MVKFRGYNKLLLSGIYWETKYLLSQFDGFRYKILLFAKAHIPTVDIATLMHVKMSTVFMVKYRMYKLKIGVKQNLSFDKFLDEF